MAASDREYYSYVTRRMLSALLTNNYAGLRPQKTCSLRLHREFLVSYVTKVATSSESQRTPIRSLKLPEITYEWRPHGFLGLVPCLISFWEVGILTPKTLWVPPTAHKQLWRPTAWAWEEEIWVYNNSLGIYNVTMDLTGGMRLTP